jgi:dolichol-phosphate mannosyltransferase
MTIDHSYITIIVPTLNEAENIERLIDSIFFLYPSINCLIVDDGSRDETQSIVLGLKNKYSNLDLMDRSKESVKGLCSSVVDGIQNCRTEHFIIIDGDGQHPPEFIQYCIKTLNLGADLSIGTREPYATRWTFSRIVISYSASILAKIRLLLCGVTIKDPMSGFFGGNTKFVRDILLQHKKSFSLGGYKVLFDILKKVPKKCNLSGFYYPFGLREYGTSKLTIKIIIRYVLSFFK